MRAPAFPFFLEDCFLSRQSLNFIPFFLEMKSLRGICKTGTSSFLEFDNEDFYWTNGHLIAKNDPFLKKAISLGGAKDKNLRQEFYFKKGSRGFYGLQTKIIQC